MEEIKVLRPEECQKLLGILKARFRDNTNRHSSIEWSPIEDKLVKSPEKLWSLQKMEETGGEPDVSGFDQETSEYLFVDFCQESPKGRRSLCYDPEALASRRENKPLNSALGMAAEMGIGLLTEQQYRELQQRGTFDTKTSSWILAPPSIRALGGAIFGDSRYGAVFIYHNGAASYYASRGFRGLLRV